MPKQIVKYDPSKIETKWQEVWEKEKVYQPDLDTAKKPFYNLMMFPYPSAEGMHVGNMYAFTGADVYGRFKRMQGHDVLEPIGLDGFGIHSENYALKTGRHPKEQAKLSEANFYRQLRATGNGFDWSRTTETYDPTYYKWTQWIFIQLFKAGLAYRKKAPVNFCPKDLTVLADEQVIDGKCERCGSIVEKRELEQWFFKITAYADRLLGGLDKIDWTAKVKIAQRNWIGKKEGITITYQLANSTYSIEVFTTRPDTNFGATFIVLAPEHPFVEKMLSGELLLARSHLTSLREYVDAARKKSEAQRIAEGRKKTGVFTGLYAINNLNGATLPIWVSDFVLGNVGTGVVVGVPGHDLRDFEFAKEMGLPVVRVVVGKDGDKSEIIKPEQVQEEEGIMINSDFLNGLSIQEAKEKIMNYLEDKGWGKRVTTFHLRDWLISRQRYWGAPIPMIFCEKCGWQAVPDEQLPVLLPEVQDWKPKGSGKSPLASIDSFVKTTCPNCGGKAERETDVSDTFLDSSWYFFRYTSTEFSDRAWDRERAKNWLPVDMYIGGAEHSVLHLLYTRFLTMVFYDLKLVSFEEPFPRFFAHGLLIKEGAKMSKSKGNVVVPDAYIKKYGADTLRTYLMFLGPFSQGGDFYDSSISGVYRFLKRVFDLITAKIHAYSVVGQEETAQIKEKSASDTVAYSSNIIDKKLEQTIKKVSNEIEHLRFNTAIAALMELLNTYNDHQNSIQLDHLKKFLLMLAPFSPHLAEELWQKVIKEAKETQETKGKKASVSAKLVSSGSSGTFVSIHTQLWPTYNPKALEEDEVTIVVQVNGKVRDTIKIQNSKVKSQNLIEEAAKTSENVQRHLEGKEVKKVVYVEGKILNFVTN